MKYFAPINQQELMELWEMPTPWKGELFIQSKKNGEPIKNGSVFHPKEMATLDYEFKIVPLCLTK